MLFVLWARRLPSRTFSLLVRCPCGPELLKRVSYLAFVCVPARQWRPTPSAQAEADQDTMLLGKFSAGERQSHRRRGHIKREAFNAHTPVLLFPARGSLSKPLRPGLAPASPGIILYAADFAGMDMGGHCLRRLAWKGLVQRFEVRQVFASELDKATQKVLRANCAGLSIFDDATLRPMPSCRISHYVAGPPCVAWSADGLKLGFEDIGARLFFVAMHFIHGNRPLTFLVENVPRFADEDGGHFIKAISATLREWSYHVCIRIMRTEEHGIPQGRHRLYIAGRHYDASDEPLREPEPILPMRATDLLAPRSLEDHAEKLPTTLAGIAAVRAARAKLAGRSDDDDWFVRIHASVKRAAKATPAQTLPTMTHSLSAGHWCGSRGRVLTATEMARFQGVADGDVVWACSSTMIYKLLGNTMSANVLDRWMCRLLAPLVDVPIPDEWEAGVAQERLRRNARTVRHGPKPLEFFGFQVQRPGSGGSY